MLTSELALFLPLHHCKMRVDSAQQLRTGIVLLPGATLTSVIHAVAKAVLMFEVLAAAGEHVKVHLLWYSWRSCECQWSMWPPATMLISMIILGPMLMFVVHT